MVLKDKNMDMFFTFHKPANQESKKNLDFPNDFKVDKSKYTHWKLNLVSKYKFNQWWSKIGSSLFEKEIEQVKEVRTARQSNTSTFIEIPNNTPTEIAKRADTKTNSNVAGIRSEIKSDTGLLS